MKFRELVLELHLPQNFCHTHRHFPEILQSCSGHPKTCKSIKNRKSKICTKPILSSTYVEESKNFRLFYFYYCIVCAAYPYYFQDWIWAGSSFDRINFFGLEWAELTVVSNLGWLRQPNQSPISSLVCALNYRPVHEQKLY